MAFTQFAGTPPPGVIACMLACANLVIVCGDGHRLAGRTTIGLAERAAATFVDLQPNWGTRKLIDKAFSDARLTRRTGFEVNDPATPLDIVAHGLGIALIP